MIPEEITRLIEDYGDVCAADAMENTTLADLLAAITKWGDEREAKGRGKIITVMRPELELPDDEDRP